MLKLIGYWSAPPNPGDVEEFEDLYLNRHCVKAAKVPHLRRLITTKVDAGLGGTEPTNYRVAELLFDDLASFEKASESPEFLAMREDAETLVEQFGVSVVGEIGMEVDHELGG